MPTARLFWIVGVTTFALIGGVAAPALTATALVAEALVVVAFFVDLFRARRAPIEARREWPTTLVQDAPQKIRVILRSRAERRLTVRLREGLHPFLAARPLRTELELLPGEQREWGYSVKPPTRGESPVLPLTARVRGPWALAWSQRDLIRTEKRRIYPQVRWEGRVGHLLALAQRQQLGSMPVGWQGAGSEFYAVRRYLRGDPMTKIHWKASARHGRLMSREETWERGARLVVLLDSARGMTSRIGTRSKLDHALAASLALTRIASARGDHVTLVAFSDRIERVVRVPPGGRLSLPYGALFDLPARLTEPAYDLAVDYVRESETRSATVVLMTSVVDLSSAELLRTSLMHLARVHRPLLIHLRDAELEALSRAAPRDAPEAFAQVASLEIRLANDRLAKLLRRGGIRVVTTPADRLALDTLESYLELFRTRLSRREHRIRAGG